MAEMYKIRTKNKDVFLRVAKGHFATMHIHTNYYIDVTTQKTRLSEAKAGTEVIGACMAEELTRDNYMNMNAHQTIYVVSPEFIGGGQMMFRDNLTPMLAKKHVLILAASVTTGKSALAAIDAINYYGGIVVGVSAIFATVEECDGHPVHSIFDPKDLGDFESYKPHHCPWCKKGEKIEALVNSYGISML